MRGAKSCRSRAAVGHVEKSAEPIHSGNPLPTPPPQVRDRDIRSLHRSTTTMTKEILYINKEDAEVKLCRNPWNDPRARTESAQQAAR